MLCGGYRGLLPGSSGTPGKHMGDTTGKEFRSVQETILSANTNSAFHCDIALNLVFS